MKNGGRLPMPQSNQRLVRAIRLISICTAASALGLIAMTWVKSVGEPSPPALSATRFTVAVLSGPKQAAQVAPENTSDTAESVIVPETPADTTPVVEAQRETSLPDAVKAAPDAKPTVEAATPVEVIPPARVSMPGGRLSAEDAPVGDSRDPFAVGPAQVYIRLLLGSDGRVVRGGIVRSGREPMRDLLIYKAIASRTFDVKSLPPGAVRIPGEEARWQLDLVIDYGTNEILP